MKKHIQTFIFKLIYLKIIIRYIFLLYFLLSVEINNIIITLVIRSGLTLQVDLGLKLIQV